MQYTVTVNQSRALEWGLNAQQAMLFAFVYECPSWAKPVTQDGVVYYALAKSKIVQELPLLTDKPDTAYRLLKQLEGKGLITLSSTASITLVGLTALGKQWNKKTDGSEIYPSRVGKKSDEGSEISPTNQYTSNQDTNNQSKPLVPSGDVTAVFDHWRTVMQKTKRTVLDSNRKRLITKALTNYSVDDVKAAITGCSLSPYHMGENDTRKRYDGLELILRNAEKIEQFMGFAERPPVNSPRPRHTGLDQANNAGLNRRDNGAYSL